MEVIVLAPEVASLSIPLLLTPPRPLGAIQTGEALREVGSDTRQVRGPLYEGSAVFLLKGFADLYTGVGGILRRRTKLLESDCVHTILVEVGVRTLY